MYFPEEEQRVLSHEPTVTDTQFKKDKPEETTDGVRCLVAPTGRDACDTVNWNLHIGEKLYATTPREHL